MMCIYMLFLYIHVVDDGNWYTHFPLTQNGATPLIVASQNGHSDVVNILIRNGACVTMAANVRYSEMSVPFVLVYYSW